MGCVLATLCDRRNSTSKILRPRTFDTLHGELITDNEPLEEEDLPGYEPEQFCPVSIGEVFLDRWQALAKVDYGGNSTIWLARDLAFNKHVILKFCTIMPSDRSSISVQNPELEAYSHPSKTVYRAKVPTTYGIHDVLIFETMGVNVTQLRLKSAPVPLQPFMVKKVIQRTLKALHFLHAEANMIHTDVKAQNLLFRLFDESVLDEFEESLRLSPPAAKKAGGRLVYQSRTFKQLCFNARNILLPVSTDLGNARVGADQAPARISSQPFRAPETILGMRWGFPVDIWAVGCMAFDVYFGTMLFNSGHGDGSEMTDALHLAQMIAYLGPPPKEFIERSGRRREFWDNEGRWKGVGGVAIPELTFEEAAESLQDENKASFLDLVRRMMRWVRTRRAGDGGSIGQAPMVHGPVLDASMAIEDNNLLRRLARRAIDVE